MTTGKEGPQEPAWKERARRERPQQPSFIIDGRTLENTFTELEREGTTGLYELLKSAIRKMPHAFFNEHNRRWNGALTKEQSELQIQFLCDGGTEVYGSTFQRAKAKWDAEVSAAPPRPLTAEEQSRVFEIPEEQGGGTLFIGGSPERGSTVQLENLFTYWIEEFTAEVEKAVKAFSDNPNAPAELQRITKMLRSFEVGTEGRFILQPMQADAAGKNLWAKFDHAKNRLVQRLERIAGEHMDPVATNGTTATQRVPWNDTAALLAYLLTELIEAEYITPPPNGRRTGRDGNRAAVADLAYQLLDIRDRSTNERVTREYFRSLMRPSSPDRDSRPDLFRIRPRVARNGPT